MGSRRRQSPAGLPGGGVLGAALKTKPRVAREDRPSKPVSREANKLRSMKCLLSRAGAEASRCLDRTEAGRILAGIYRRTGSSAVARRSSVLNLMRPDSTAKKLCLLSWV